MTKQEMEAVIAELEAKKAEISKDEYAPNAWVMSKSEALILDMLIKIYKHEKEKP